MVRNALVTHIDGEQCVAWAYDENLSMSIWEFIGLGKYSASAGGGGLNGEQIVKKKHVLNTLVSYMPLHNKWITN